MLSVIHIESGLKYFGISPACLSPRSSWVRHSIYLSFVEAVNPSLFGLDQITATFFISDILRAVMNVIFDSNTRMKVRNFIL